MFIKVIKKIILLVLVTVTVGSLLHAFYDVSRIQDLKNEIIANKRKNEDLVEKYEEFIEDNLEEEY